MNFNNAKYELSCGTSKQLFDSTLPEIAFSGRSNVGKSSLLNKILNRKALARTSSVPGKTVTINFFRLNECFFVDLPGYGYAKVSNAEKQRWADLMEGYFSSGRNIKLVVQLIDMRHNPSEQDIQMITFLQESGIPFVVAMTKSDKLKPMARAAQDENLRNLLKKYGEFEIIQFSAEKGTGVDELKKCIEKSIEGENDE